MLAADPEQSSVSYSHMTNKGKAVKKPGKDNKPRKRHRGFPMAKPGEQLTLMEIKVLNWCSNGHTKARIAKRFGMSESYVKFFFERISSKLRARTAAHAVAEGFRRGYLK